MQAFQYPEVYRDETAVSTALAGSGPAGVWRPPGPAVPAAASLATLSVLRGWWCVC